jgi:hypothetical protein
MNEQRLTKGRKTPTVELVVGTAPGPRIIDAQTRHELVAQAAYFRAQRRGFAPGREQEDWYAAEAEIDAAVNPPTRK